MSNPRKTVLYTGVTNDLVRRVEEHKTSRDKKSFAARYNISKLVYFEMYESIEDAIIREKQIKAGSRAKKVILIEKINPEWGDLSGELV